MKHAVAISIVILFLVGVTDAQRHSVESVVSNDVMEQVVARILRSYFKPGRRPREVLISDRAIKSSWLPRIRNVRFRVVPADQEETHVGNFYTFDEPEKDVNRILVHFGIFDPSAGGTGDIWAFRVNGSDVRVWRTGEEWGSSGIDRGPSAEKSPSP